MKKQTMIVVLLILCVALCSCGFRAHSYADGGYRVGEGHVSGKVERVEIEWVDGSVQLGYHGAQEITFSETTERSVDDDGRMRWKLEGTTLRIRYSASGFHSWSAPGKHLTVMLPRDLTLDALKINVVSGEVSAEGLMARECHVDTVSGGVQLGFASEMRLMAMNTVSGDVTLRFAQAPDAIDADAVSGDVTLLLPAGEGFTAEVDSVSGSVAGDLPMTREGKDRYACGSGACSIDVDTVSGDVRFGRAD